MGSGVGRDPAELPQASYVTDMAQLIEGDEPDDVRDAMRRFSRVLTEAWALVAEHPRVDVAFWAIAVADKMDIVVGRTSGQLALMLGVSEADFSKTVNHYADLLNLPRPPSLKSQNARESYSRVQSEDHWRDRDGRDFVARHRKKK